MTKRAHVADPSAFLTGPAALVLAPISGGGSARPCAPADGLPLADKMAVAILHAEELKPQANPERSGPAFES